MKARTLAVVVAGLVGLGTATLLIAHEGPRHEPRAQMLQKFDQDNDGKLSQEEFQAARDMRMQHRFQRLDADGDGSVTLDEFKQHRADKMAKRFERMDRDDDGYLSKEDMRHGPKHYGKHHGMHHGKEGCKHAGYGARAEAGSDSDGDS